MPCAFKRSTHYDMHVLTVKSCVLELATMRHGVTSMCTATLVDGVRPISGKGTEAEARGARRDLATAPLRVAAAARVNMTVETAVVDL